MNPRFALVWLLSVGWLPLMASDVVVSKSSRTLRNEGKQFRFCFWEVSASELKAAKTGFDWLLPTAPKKSGFLGFLGSGATKSERPSDNDEPHSHIRGVFTDPQFQMILKVLEKDGIEPKQLPTVAARPGDPAVSQTKDRHYEAVATLGGDGTTADLSVYLPESGYARSHPDKPYFEIQLEDGYIVVFSVGKGSTARAVFVMTEILDPAGRPVRRLR